MPIALPADKIQCLLTALPFREKTLVLLAAGTGLRLSELFAMKWRDIHFETGEIDGLTPRVESKVRGRNLCEAHFRGAIRERVVYSCVAKLGRGNRGDGVTCIANSSSAPPTIPVRSFTRRFQFAAELLLTGTEAHARNRPLIGPDIQRMVSFWEPHATRTCLEQILSDRKHKHS